MVVAGDGKRTESEAKYREKDKKGERREKELTISQIASVMVTSGFWLQRRAGFLGRWRGKRIGIQGGEENKFQKVQRAKEEKCSSLSPKVIIKNF